MSANGVLGDPTGASAEEGRACWPPAVDDLVGTAAAGLREPDHGGDPMSRVAVVTGAARGIGAATVRGLAAAGWSVVAVDRAADDPRLPYPMGTEAELRRWWPRRWPCRRTRQVARTATGAWPTWPTPPTPRRSAPPWPGPRSGSGDSTPWWRWPG